MDNYLLNLSQEQARAATHSLGPAICIAGPGSGKTTTLVSRLRYMLEHLNISPSSILVVTFTREAAINMKNRFLSYLNLSKTEVSFGTFHSIFYHMLKKENDLSSYSIIDENRSITILRTILEGRNNLLASNNDLLKEILNEISRFKSTQTSIKEYNPTTLSKEQFISIYKDYNNYLKEYSLIDFEDIQNKTWQLLNDNSAFRMFWQNRFKYILIDEFQDINKIQFNIMKLLAAPGNNLFVVGDDDQSIYSFRGASPSVMKTFRVNYPEAKVLYLTTNYRSTSLITEGATKLIKNNTNRYLKDIKSLDGAGQPITIHAFDNPNKEYVSIAKQIKSELDRGSSPDDYALLFRTNSELGRIAGTLLRLGIPFKTKAHIPTLFDNPYVKPIIAMLDWINGKHSRENLLIFANKPVRYITRASLTSEEIDLDQLENDYKKCGKAYVAANIYKLRKQLAFAAHLTPKMAIKFIRKEMGYDNYLNVTQGLDNKEIDDATQKLNELEMIADEYRKINEFLSYISELEAKLLEVSGRGNNFTGNDKAPAPAVSLLTYHGCKGLEFKNVFMPNCVEGITPWKMSTSDWQLEEERRMFYVAMTRAISRLTITYSKRNSSRDTPVSRFVMEVQR